MVLRMVRIQVPIVVISSVAAGRMACCSTFPMKTGTHLSLTPKTRISISPIQKYGITEVITNTGGMMLSSRPPRRHAPRMPMPVPSTKARIVVSPTRPSGPARSAAPADAPSVPGHLTGQVPRDSPLLLRRRQVQHLLAPVGIVVGSRLRVRVAFGDPAAEAAGVVLEPLAGLRDRDDRHVLQHHLLQLVHDRMLSSLARRRAVLVDQCVLALLAVPLPVGAGRRAEPRRVAPVAPLAQLE